MSEDGSENGDTGYEVIYADSDEKHPFLIKDGFATATHPNGDIYVGEYKDGKRHGKGTYTFSNKAVYEGEYVSNKKQGYGVMITPDGGKYEGEWLDDKRHGQGKYSYPNGDLYEGGWRNNQKHGTGLYTYANTGTHIKAEWSNGHVVYGAVNMHDGSAYMGHFADNKPQGEGHFVLSSGSSMAGRLEEGKWRPEKFAKPTLTGGASQTPKPSLPDALTKAWRDMEKAVLKVDHFEAIYRLKKVYEGVPNYRKVEGFPVYGSGQPTIEGFKAVLADILQEGIDKVVWVNMRQEPVLYVDDMSYAPRHRRDLNENMELPGLSNADLLELEERVTRMVIQRTKRHGGLFSYYQDTFAENPADRKNTEHHYEVKDLEQIRSVAAVYEFLRTEEELTVDYTRLPIVDERSPSLEDFDRLVHTLKGLDASTAACFNCQMGKGRTTTGMVVAVLLRKVLEPEHKEDAEPPEFDEAEPNHKAGQFSIIMRLVKALKDGPVIKAEVDDAIDRCHHMQNLRECILYTKEMFEKETEDRRKFWKRMSVNFLERYFYLIAFHAYLREHVEDDFSTPFAKWVQTRAQLFTLLGTRSNGPLSEFNWD